MTDARPRASRRDLPPLVSDGDRIAAAKIAADQLCAEFRQTDLLRALWLEEATVWRHMIEPSGAIVSRLQ